MNSMDVYVLDGWVPFICFSAVNNAVLNISSSALSLIPEEFIQLTQFSQLCRDACLKIDATSLQQLAEYPDCYHQLAKLTDKHFENCAVE
jgi:hypothetical protein